MMKKISILGCGWLGLPLAKTLIEKGNSVKGSTTSIEKIIILKELEIEPYTISLSANEIKGNINSFLDQSEVLIINIPPKLRGSNKENFVEKITTLVPFIEKSSIKKVLFVSSTSVYADDNESITEESPENPDSESGRQLLEVEHLLIHNSNFETTLVRFGGLIGEDRHPVRFLSGRDNIENPKAPINLIHQVDCIGIILKIIELNYWGETFNAVAPFHPSKEEYYTQKALAMNLALPRYNYTSSSIGKTILSNKVEQVLDYKFMRANL